MRFLWLFLAYLSAAVIALFFATPMDSDSLIFKWIVIMIFVISAIRLVYYERQLLVIRTIALILATVALYYLKPHLDLESPWITQTMMYENVEVHTRTIELQTKQIGEQQQERIVDRFSFLPKVYWKEGELDTTALQKLDTVAWRKIDRRR